MLRLSRPLLKRSMDDLAGPRRYIGARRGGRVLAGGAVSRARTMIT